MIQFRTIFTLLSLCLLVTIPHLQADERRAPAPKFSAEQTRGVFFDDLNSAFRGPRPTVASVRQAGVQAMQAATAAAEQDTGSGGDTWSSLISPGSIEDEVKRVKLAFDAAVTTPIAFNGGEYQDARVYLTALASMFAIITEHGEDVRWKKQAAAARDLIARTAFNCKAGSTQVYNEVKLRKGDLQDLVAGSGLTNKEGEGKNDWAMIADRAPLMQYAESTVEALKEASRDEATIKREVEAVKRNAEVLAVLGEILAKEGMDDSDDEDYTTFSRGMTTEASAIVSALERDDMEAVRKGASMIRKRCDACHEQYN